MPRKIMRRLALLVLALSWAREAGAVTPFEDPYDLPEAPRAPTLPELTHPDIEGTFEATLGLLTPKSNTPSWSHATPSYVQRLGVEMPLGPRRLFVGANYEAAFGGPPDANGSAKVVGGNLEAYGRAVWATRTGLAFGGGLSLMLPAATFDQGGAAEKIATAAAAVRPWDFSFFNAEAWTARPFVDMRAVDGRFVVQLRAQLDWSFITGDATKSALSAVAALYLGYRFGRVGVGLEAFELYFIDARVPDNARAYFSVSPSVRVMTPWVQPAISLLTNVRDPLYPSSSRAIGVRLAITAVWDRTTSRIQMGSSEASEPAE